MSVSPPILPPLPLVAALPQYPTLSESIAYQLTGLVVVFTALGLIWALLEIMALWFKRQAKSAKPVAVPVPRAESVPAVAAADPTPEVLAAIAAALHLTFNGSVRITSVVRIDAPDHEWGLEGRRQIHSARKVR